MKAIQEKTTLAPLGVAELRFFGLHIYTAKLDVTADFQPMHYAQSPLALTINYSRAIEGALIAERSLLEMKRQGKISSETASVWLGFMASAFPNITAGDTLMGRSDGKGGVTFLHNGALTAQLQDADFAQRFFGIWLDKATSAPEIRAQLMGAHQG